MTVVSSNKDEWLDKVEQLRENVSYIIKLGDNDANDDDDEDDEEEEDDKNDGDHVVRRYRSIVHTCQWLLDHEPRKSATEDDDDDNDDDDDDILTRRMRIAIYQCYAIALLHLEAYEDVIRLYERHQDDDRQEVVVGGEETAVGSADDEDMLYPSYLFALYKLGKFQRVVQMINDDDMLAVSSGGGGGGGGGGGYPPLPAIRHIHAQSFYHMGDHIKSMSTYQNILQSVIGNNNNNKSKNKKDAPDLESRDEIWTNHTAVAASRVTPYCPVVARPTDNDDDGRKKDRTITKTIDDDEILEYLQQGVQDDDDDDDGFPYDLAFNVATKDLMTVTTNSATTSSDSIAGDRLLHRAIKACQRQNNESSNDDQHDNDEDDLALQLELVPLRYHLYEFGPSFSYLPRRQDGRIATSSRLKKALPPAIAKVLQIRDALSLYSQLLSASAANANKNENKKKKGVKGGSGEEEMEAEHDDDDNVNNDDDDSKSPTATAAASALKFIPTIDDLLTCAPPSKTTTTGITPTSSSTTTTTCSQVDRAWMSVVKWTPVQWRIYMYNVAVLQYLAQDYTSCRSTCQDLDQMHALRTSTVFGNNNNSNDDDNQANYNNQNDNNNNNNITTTTTTTSNNKGNKSRKKKQQQQQQKTVKVTSTSSSSSNKNATTSTNHLTKNQKKELMHRITHVAAFSSTDTDRVWWSSRIAVLRAYCSYQERRQQEQQQQRQQQRSHPNGESDHDDSGGASIPVAKNDNARRRQRRSFKPTDALAILHHAIESTKTASSSTLSKTTIVYDQVLCYLRLHVATIERLATVSMNATDTASMSSLLRDPRWMIDVLSKLEQYPSVVATLASLHHQLNENDKVQTLLEQLQQQQQKQQQRGSHDDDDSAVIDTILLKTEFCIAQGRYIEAVEWLEREGGIVEEDDAEVTARHLRHVEALSHVDPERAIEVWSTLQGRIKVVDDDEEDDVDDASVHGAELEVRELPRLSVQRSQHMSSSMDLAHDQLHAGDSSRRRQQQQQRHSREKIMKRRAKKREEYISKLEQAGLYRRDHPTKPDPERWLPKYERTNRRGGQGYAGGRRQHGDQQQHRGAQGTFSANDAAKLDVAARVAAAATGNDSNTGGRSTAHMTVSSGSTTGRRR